MGTSIPYIEDVSLVVGLQLYLLANSTYSPLALINYSLPLLVLTIQKMSWDKS